MRIPLSEIYVDAALQTRALAGPVDPALVEEYASEMRRGKQFPPIDAFTGDWIPDGKRYTPVDGFHRVSAALAVREEIGIKDIEAKTHVGSRQDALKFSIGANHAHGQRVTNPDKRKKVNLLLDVPEWAALFDTVLAEWAGVSSMFVGNVRRERAAALNGLTVEEDEERASEVVRISRDTVLAAAGFAKCAVGTNAKQAGLFWNPEQKRNPDNLPPDWEPGSTWEWDDKRAHPALDKLAAALSLTVHRNYVRIKDVHAKAIICRLTGIAPGELGRTQSRNPHLDTLALALYPRLDDYLLVSEPEAERILARLGDLKPGELAPEGSN